MSCKNECSPSCPRRKRKRKPACGVIGPSDLNMVDQDFRDRLPTWVR